MAECILSQRGKNKFSHDGYLFVFEKFSKVDNDLMFWRCDEMGRCKARIHTRLGMVVKEINSHTHDSSSIKVEVAKVTTKLKNRAQETMERTSVLLNEVLATTPQSVQGSLSSADAMKKIIRRKRNEISAAPPDPLDLHELVLPEKYRCYQSDPDTREDFLLNDSGPGDKRILLFGRKTWLVHLNSSVWYVDGTFKITPTLFSQVYVISVKKLDGVIPVIYALLPDKQRATYVRLFELIKECHPYVNPGSIICDYELAAFSAMKEIFPDVEIKGCFFHLSQNMQKHIGTLGLTNLYNNNIDFCLNAKMILALAFVPIERIDDYLDSLSENLSEEHIPLLNWLEDSYIGRMNRRGNNRRSPIFPPEMWNLYRRTLNNEDRTNNHAEASNRRLQAELNMDHPSIWKLITALKKIQKSRDTYLESLIAGHSAPAKLKKYRDADQRILRIVNEIDQRTPIEYLRGIAHNF